MFESSDDFLLLLVLGVALFAGSIIAALLTVEAKNRRAGQGHGKYAPPESRLSRLMRSKTVRGTAIALGILAVTALGYRGWLIQHPQTVHMKTAPPAPTARTSQAGAPPEKIVGVARPNPAAHKPFDVEAARRTVDAEIRSWASAWAKQRVDEYLGFYSPDFVPPNGATRNAWDAARRERINRAQHLSVSIAEIKFLRIEPTRAVVVFRQHYKSATLTAESIKTQSWVYSDGRWRINREEDKSYAK